MKHFRAIAIALLSAIAVGAVGVAYGLIEWLWIMLVGFWG